MFQSNDRPIKEYYDMAIKFLELDFNSKFVIGYNIGILDERDKELSVEEIEEEVFEQAIKNSLYLRFVEEFNRIIKLQKRDDYEKKIYEEREFGEKIFRGICWHDDIPSNILE